MEEELEGKREDMVRQFSYRPVVDSNSNELARPDGAKGSIHSNLFSLAASLKEKQAER